MIDVGKRARSVSKHYSKVVPNRELEQPHYGVKRLAESHSICVLKYFHICSRYHIPLIVLSSMCHIKEDTISDVESFYGMIQFSCYCGQLA